MPLSWLAMASLWLVLGGQFALLSLLAIGGAALGFDRMHALRLQAHQCAAIGRPQQQGEREDSNDGNDATASQGR